MGDKIIITKDGSQTIQSAQFGVTYHSIHGAIQETYHVFIEAGLRFKANENKKLSILEIGWGTGLNSLITWIEANKNGYSIDYTTYEAYPISLKQAEELQYESNLKDITFENLSQLHNLTWNKSHHLKNSFYFKKIKKKFEEISDHNLYDIIYFDAFAPNAQSQFWEEPFLSKMFNALKTSGVLVTYCAKGSFKRALKSVGFEVQKLPGPPGKREMTRGLKPKN